MHGAVVMSGFLSKIAATAILRDCINGRACFLVIICNWEPAVVSVLLAVVTLWLLLIAAGNVLINNGHSIRHCPKYPFKPRVRANFHRGFTAKRTWWMVPATRWQHAEQLRRGSFADFVQCLCCNSRGGAVWIQTLMLPQPSPSASNDTRP